MLSLDRLDARATDYRFRLEDVPWDRLDEPGALVGPTLRRLLDHDDLDGARIAVAFASLERDLLAFLHEDAPGGRSVALLVEEEARHAEMFERLARHFAAPPAGGRAPPEAEAGPGALPRAPAVDPPGADRPPDTFVRLAAVEDPAVRRHLFWLHCLFFEELTVWIHDALARDDGLQPTWLTAHRLHAREEAQHVLTDAAFLDASPLDPTAREQLSRAFVLYVDQHIDAFFGIPARRRRLRDLPLFDEVLSHRAFARTRAVAPYLTTLRTRREARLVGPDLPPSEDTLPAALVRAAGSAGGLTFVARSSTVRSYADLHARALRILGGLQARGLGPGAAVVIACGAPLAAVEALWACLLGGLVPALVPLPIGGRESESHRRLQRVAAQLDAPRLTDQEGPIGEPTGRPVLRLAELDGDGVPHPSRPDDLALLQYSSGSLGQPRGVRLTHRQVLANVHAMAAHRGRAGDRFASWLPLSHDMGLVGFHLAPVALGCDQLLAPPRAWLRAPADWLRVLADFGATVTGLPASALPALLAAPADGPDLSRLHTVLVGAEPIDAGTLRAVAARLAPLGLAPEALCPAYGLAEATLAVSMEVGPPQSLRVLRDSLRPGARVVPAPDEAGVDVVRVGTPVAGLTVRAGAQAGEVGEIVVTGASVADGYQGDPERWTELATGDLGFVWEGALYVCGRQKDTFEVNGQTFHAHDVERVAQEVPGVRAAALGLGEERVLFVVPDAEARGGEAVLPQVRRHLRVRMDFVPDRLVTARARDLLRTTSGKLRRAAILAAWRDTRDAGETDLVRRVWAEVLDLPLPEVGPDDDFRALGGTSLRALEVHARLEEALDRELGHEVLAGTTPRQIARRLGAGPPVEVAPPAPRPPAPRPTATPREAAPEPLAIVALAVRFPDAPTPEALWELLRDGRNVVRAVDRWDTAGRPAERGALFPRAALRSFDPEAFGLREEEARAMDPQHRLALELAAEALQAAPPDTDRVGLFLGCGDLEPEDRAIGPHTLLGSLKNMVAGRIAGALGLTGPALAVDTACSSSLVAVHLAARAVREGDCDLALAGGVQLLLTPQGFRSFEAAGLLSATGESRPFDRAASGLVPGEGGGVVAITTLSRARRLGHRVLALLRGSAVTNDGGGFSSTAPSPDGQEAAMRGAWRDAGLDPRAAGYVEAHAAGTAIGDAVEATATARVFPAVPLASVKGNLGHTLAAAGVAGLARALLSIEHGWLPPSAGLSEPTTRVPWSELGLVPLREGAPWAGRRVAGVSSFGLGGTNAHVVVEAADAVAPVRVEVQGPPRLEAALAPLRPRAPSVALVLAGPGAQHAGMARALRAAVPAFAALLDRCDALAGGDLLASFDDARCLGIAEAQRTTFALTWALGRWLLDLGLSPSVVFGHSGGELSAAVLTGVHTLEEGWALAAERGRLMARVPGGLLAVLGPLDAVPEGTWISARNAPGQVVLAGRADALAAVEAALGPARVRRLAVDCPAHSPLLEAEAEPYLRLSAAIPPRSPDRPLLSTRTAAPLVPSAAHWRDQLLGTVEFEATVRAAHAAGATVFVDVGPSSGLAAAVRATLGRVDAVSLLSRSDASLAPTTRGLARLVALGALPRLAGLPAAPLTFRRRPLDAPPPARAGDHLVRGVATVPAAALYDLALRLTGAPALERAVVLRPCPDGAALALEGGQLLADGVAVLRFTPGPAVPRPDPVDLAALRRRCPAVGSPRRLREALAASGMVLGPRLWALRALVTGEDELLAELALPPDGEAGHALDPALLDSASQAAAALGSREATWVGFGVDRLVVHAPVHGGCLAWLRVRHRSPETVVMDLRLLAPDGAVNVDVEGLSARRYTRSPAAPAPRAAPADPVPADGSPIRALLARRIGRDPAQVGRHTPFSQLGIDSLAAVELAAQIEALVGYRMPVTLLFECPDLASLEARLAAVAPGAP